MNHSAADTICFILGCAALAASTSNGRPAGGLAALSFATLRGCSGSRAVGAVAASSREEDLPRSSPGSAHSRALEALHQQHDRHDAEATGQLADRLPGEAECGGCAVHSRGFRPRTARHVRSQHRHNEALPHALYDISTHIWNPAAVTSVCRHLPCCALFLHMWRCAGLLFTSFKPSSKKCAACNRLKFEAQKGWPMWLHRQNAYCCTIRLAALRAWWTETACITRSTNSR